MKEILSSTNNCTETSWVCPPSVLAPSHYFTEGKIKEDEKDKIIEDTKPAAEPLAIGHVDTLHSTAVHTMPSHSQVPAP